MDEERGVTAGRNSLKSINEVLREGRLGRDKSKVRVKFNSVYCIIMFMFHSCSFVLTIQMLNL